MVGRWGGEGVPLDEVLSRVYMREGGEVKSFKALYQSIGQCLL